MKIVILENIRSLHNVGAIFRTVDGAGWDKIILTGYTGVPPDRRIEKVSLGAESWIDWEQIDNVPEYLQSLKSFSILGLEQTMQSKNIFEYTPAHSDRVLIVGNEVEGVSKTLLNLCDDHLEIPMQGKKSSLNVSVATGIALYALS